MAEVSMDIEANDNLDPSQDEVNPAAGMDKKKRSQPPPPKDEEQQGQTSRPKKKQRRNSFGKASKGKKKNSEDNKEQDNEESAPTTLLDTVPITEEEILEWKREYMKERSRNFKQALEQQREETYGKISTEYKQNFGKIAFSTFYKRLLPILILDPFNAPHDTIRNPWLKMFEKNKYNTTSWIVYWYGFGTTDPSQCFSYLKPSEIVSYDNGVKKKVHKLPPFLQQKIEKKSRLSKKDEGMRLAYDELEEDLKKDPSQRRARGVLVKEEHEYTDIEEIEWAGIIPEPPSNRRKSAVDSDAKSNVKGGSKKKKSLNNKKSEKVTTGSTEGLDTEKITQEDSKPDAFEEVAMDAIGDQEMSSDDNDDDYRDGGVLLDDDALQVDEISEKAGKIPTKKLTKGESKKKKKTSARKDKPVVDENERKRLEEKAAFRRCEREFTKLLDELSNAIETEDPTKLNRSLIEVKNVVDQFSATYMEAYEIASMLKKSKGVLKAQKADLGIYKKVIDACKETYTRKKNALPEGFKIEKKIKRKSSVRSPGSVTPKAAAEQNSESQHDAEPDTAVEKAKKTKRSVSPIPTTEREKVPPDAEQDNLVKSEVAAVFQPNAQAPQKRTEKVVPTVLERDDSRDVNAPTSSQPDTQHKMKAATKVPFKQFSLKGLMNHGSKGDDVPSEETMDTVPIPRKETTEKTEEEGEEPKSAVWITEPLHDYETISDRKRLSGLEFLRAMSLLFPSDKVNRESIARSIEAAVHQSATNQDNSDPECEGEDLYWNKIHMIVACVLGDPAEGSKPGTLLDMIVSGHFMTAQSLVALSDEQFEASREGQPLSL